MTQNIILNNLEIEHKIKRIAYQIYETFVDEDTIVLAGISKNGYIFAEKIAKSLTAISDIKIILCGPPASIMCTTQKKVNSHCCTI